MDAMRAKLRQAILYLEQNPTLVISITSFPYIVNSLDVKWYKQTQRTEAATERRRIHLALVIQIRIGCNVQ